MYSKREKVVKFLQSNPVQVILCVIVLLDAGIVIAQILLDLNSVKEKLQRKEQQLSTLVDYVRETHADHLVGYDGDDVDRIIWLLRRNATGRSLVNPPVRWSPMPVTASTAHTPLTGTVPSRRNTITEDDRRQQVNVVAGGNSNVTSATVTPPEVGLVTQFDHDAHFPPSTEKSDSMSGLAHGLHFASIGMLGFLVLEIVDAIIIISSFTIDLILLSGVSGEEGQKAVAILIVLLLWRIARVVDGIVVTVKQRQEFRIRLQKRARRAAERKLDSFEEERLIRTKQIEALKQLCLKAGIRDAEIAACSAAHFGAANSTLGALSSVAHLSVSMTMLMSSTPSTTNCREQSPDMNHHRVQNQHRHHHHHNKLQHHHQQQHPPSPSSSAQPPGSSSADECTTSGCTLPTTTPSISAVLDQLFDNDDDYLRKIRSNVRGRFYRHHDRGGLRHERLVFSLLPDNQRTPTSPSSRPTAELSKAPSRIESLPNVHNGSPVNHMTKITALSSPVTRRNATGRNATSPSSELCYQKRVHAVAHSSTSIPMTTHQRIEDDNSITSQAYRPSKTDETSCDTARSNYGLVTSDDDEEDNSSTTSSDDSLNQRVLESKLRVAFAAAAVNNEAVIDGDLPPSISNSGQHQQPMPSSSSPHRCKRSDTTSKFTCRWRRPSDVDGKAKTLSTVQPPSLPPIATTVLKADVRSRTTNHGSIDNRVGRRPPEASPTNCTGVRIVIGSSSGSDDLTSDYGNEVDNGRPPVVVTERGVLEVDSVIGSSSSSLAATVQSNTSSPLSAADLPIASESPLPLIKKGIVSSTLTSAHPFANVVNDDYISASTPMSTGSQLFLLGDSLE